MNQALDTLAASRKLQDVGMQGPHAEAVVEVVNDAMKNLVTKDQLKAELDQSFQAFERKLEKRFTKIDDRFEAMDAKFEAKFNEVNKKLDKAIADGDKRLDKAIAESDKKFEQSNEKMAAIFDASICRLESKMNWRLVIWMLGFGGLSVSIVGTVVAMLRIFP